MGFSLGLLLALALTSAPAQAQGRATCLHDLSNAPLECVGVSPFFNLTISGARAEFARIGRPVETWYAADCRYGQDADGGGLDRSVFVMPLRDLGSSERGEAVVAHTGHCDLGYDDTPFAAELRMRTPAGEAVTGCCRLKPHTGRETPPLGE